MYVCLCKAVTDKEIEHEICGGAKCVKHIAKSLGVGTQCGKCCKEVKEMIQKSLSPEQPKMGPA